MKKIRLFVMFYMVKFFEKIGDNMYLNIRVELKKKENQVVSDKLINKRRNDHVLLT